MTTFKDRMDRTDKSECTRRIWIYRRCRRQTRQREKNAGYGSPLRFWSVPPFVLTSWCGRWVCRRTVPHPLFTSRLYVRTRNDAEPVCSSQSDPLALPYAVMLLETLVAWGVRHFFFLGWCGAVSPVVKIGDILFADRGLYRRGNIGSLAAVHEKHRRFPIHRRRPLSKSSLLEPENTRLRAGSGVDHGHHVRETPNRAFAGRRGTGDGAWRCRPFFCRTLWGIDIGGILVVSDELSSLHWLPGFKTEAFAFGTVPGLRDDQTLCQHPVDPHITKRVAELERVLHHHNHRYYVLGRPGDFGRRTTP